MLTSVDKSKTRFVYQLSQSKHGHDKKKKHGHNHERNECCLKYANLNLKTFFSFLFLSDMDVYLYSPVAVHCRAYPTNS